MVLVHSPSSQHTCDLFERATLLLFQYMDNFPLVVYLLQALNKIAACSGLALSDRALRVSQRLHSSTAQLSDTPITLALPLSLRNTREDVGTRAMNETDGRRGRRANQHIH